MLIAPGNSLVGFGPACTLDIDAALCLGQASSCRSRLPDVDGRQIPQI